MPVELGCHRRHTVILRLHCRVLHQTSKTKYTLIATWSSIHSNIAFIVLNMVCHYVIGQLWNASASNERFASISLLNLNSHMDLHYIVY